MHVILNHLQNNINQVRTPTQNHNLPLEDDDSFLDQREDQLQRRQPNLRNYVKRDCLHRNTNDSNDPSRRVKVEALKYDGTHNPNKFLDWLVKINDFLNGIRWMTIKRFHLQNKINWAY